ncbi:MAG: S8 family serine peptidase, partial [Ferruginibacter sp.]
MKKTACLLSLFILVLSLVADAQLNKYIVRLKNKSFNNFSITTPSQFLSQRAIQRRTRYNIAVDSTDLPVTQRYLDSIRLAGNVIILNTSKWLNQVLIQTTDAAALNKINSFTFVAGTIAIAPFATPSPELVNKKLDMPGSSPAPLPEGPTNPADANGYYNYGASNGQVKIHNGDFLHNHGFRGEGMHMAVLDAGFYHYLSLPTFDSMRLQNRVLGTWDFVENNASVDEDNSHGMQCLSIIAANLPGVFVGTAPKTSFYLYRTEDVASEYPIEEQNFAAGLERADSLGVDITSTSLGYSQFDNPALNYTYADMNGNTTISARAADYAAKKGILNVVAAGNEGNSAWHYIITPSDADSVLAVGAVDTLGNIGSFSSYGPSSDGQIKPGVASVGVRTAVANTSNGLPVYGNGTSFACPNMAGIATCLWQAFPEVNNMTIIETLEKSATKYTAPDNRVGYGIPDVKKAFVMLQRITFSKQATLNNCKIELALAIKTDNSMQLIVERKLPLETVFTSLPPLAMGSNFSLQNFVYADPVVLQNEGNIQYRFKMVIGTDTTYTLDSLTVLWPASCIPVNPENKYLVGPNPT